MRSAASLRLRRVYPPYGLGHQIGRWLKVVGWISAAHPPEPGNAQGMVHSILACRQTGWHRRDGLRVMSGASVLGARSGGCAPPFRCVHDGLIHPTALHIKPGGWLKVVGWISAAHPPEPESCRVDKRSASTRTGHRPRHGSKHPGLPANPLPLPEWIANDARDLGPGGVVRWMRSFVSLRSRRAYPPYGLAHQTGRWLKFVGWISAAHPPEPGNAQGMVQTVWGRWRTRHHRRDGLRMMQGTTVLAARIGG